MYYLQAKTLSRTPLLTYFVYPIGNSSNNCKLTETAIPKTILDHFYLLAPYLGAYFAFVVIPTESCGFILDVILLLF